MNVKITVPAACCVLASLAGPSGGAAASPPLAIDISLSTSAIEVGENIRINVTVSSLDGESPRFRIGSFPEYFGVYILGPWGPVQPDLKKVRQENWMHGQHNASREVVIEKGKPFSTSFELAEYFRTEKPTQQYPGPVDGLLSGKHQMNIKFFIRGADMSAPIDSGPVIFVVKEATLSNRLEGDIESDADAPCGGDQNPG